MRTLEELRIEILNYYHEGGLKASLAIDKAAPFDDIEPESLDTIIRAGLSHLIGRDNEWLREHPTEDEATKERRSYLGRWQHRPRANATAQFAYKYPHLTIRFYVGDDINKPLQKFYEADTDYVLNHTAERRKGLQRRERALKWLKEQYKDRPGSMIEEWPEGILAQADAIVGEAWS